MFSSALQSFAGWVREQWHAHRVATIAEREVGISDALHLLEDTQSETDAVTDPYRQNQRIRSARYEARSSYGRYLSFGDDHHWHATHSRDYENFVAEEGQGVVEEIDQAYDDLRHERDMAQREADSALGQSIQIATLLVFASNPEVLAEGALGAGTRASLTRFGSSDSPLLVRPRGLFHPPGVAGSRPIVAADEGELVEFIQPRLGRAVQARTAQAVGRAGLTGESRAARGAQALGRGSTANLSRGTTLARNLREQLAVEQAMANPAAGRQLGLRMTDPRWPGSEGWVKMQQVIQSGGREGPINVHYLLNRTTGAIDDFKIVLPGPR